ncbi:DUF647-domain-containing protein [Polychaeton citri CBS 116435]|uniref:DUF647-domain-containing protein n=1 Tax=Polychaeton citri CBS 116435 TaxID=1314669 RepID=A0A9P4Q8A4_9PEZI|nr:DUF647-domain-containing protein [Polychaeton citri CBS 116435]
MAVILEIVERDEADNIIGTYIESRSESTEEPSNRIDVVYPNKRKPSWQRLLDVFLPTGYPHSVTEDYLEYQIYDSLQAFSSSIAGLLSSRAVLSSVGVGDASASATAALLLSILQESAGRIATILFAHRLGTSLEPECKMYRLLADVLNDIAFVLDCLSPAFPKPLRVIILSSSSVLRALCGVAAGSAKASLSAHFAKWGNLGELNAKDSSQETVISLVGMLVGSLVVSWVVTPAATWTTLILLLAIHLETNRRAVRAVSMRTLNRQRATLVYNWLKAGRVPSPSQVSAQERIFERDGVLRNTHGATVGYCTVGCKLSKITAGLGPRHATTGSLVRTETLLSKILDTYHDQAYVLWSEPCTANKQLQFHIALKRGATVRDQLTAWWQALELADAAQGEDSPLCNGMTYKYGAAEVIQASIARSQTLMQQSEDQLLSAGWDLGTSALETLGSSRITIPAKQ